MLARGDPRRTRRVEAAECALAVKITYRLPSPTRQVDVEFQLALKPISEMFARAGGVIERHHVLTRNVADFSNVANLHQNRLVGMSTKR